VLVVYCKVVAPKDYKRGPVPDRCAHQAGTSPLLHNMLVDFTLIVLVTPLTMIVNTVD